jgi:DNA-binding XRE family transcriptional regulator
MHGKYIVLMRALRVVRCMTQADLARRVGVGRLTILRIERGYRRPKAWERRRIARILGISSSILFPEYE